MVVVGPVEERKILIESNQKIGHGRRICCPQIVHVKVTTLGEDHDVYGTKISDLGL